MRSVSSLRRYVGRRWVMGCVGTVAGPAPRMIHTPPGGFEQELPLSLGRGGKGEPSNINSLAMKKRISRMKKNRKKLNRNAAASVYPDRVKEDLQRLIKKNAAYAGRRYPPEEAIQLVGEGSGEESFFNDRIEGYFHRMDAARVASKAGPRGSNAQWGSGRSGSGAATDEHAAVGNPTLLDAAVEETTSMLGEVSAFPSNPVFPDQQHSTDRGVAPDTVTSVNAAATHSSMLFPLDVDAAAHEGRARNTITQIPQETDSWGREQSLEKRFAVTPGSTVFGSDLDRLERDMLREYDQRGASLPPMDKVYRKFGAGRQGKRMQWEPSSSFDRMPASAFAGNRARESFLGDEQNRNLSAYHMSAEAYRERHAFASENANRSQATKGINLVKHHTTLVKEGNAGIQEEARVAEPSAATGEEGDLPASANPHFPTESTSDSATASFEGSAGSIGDAPWRSAMEGRVVEVNAKTDYHPSLTTVRGEDDAFPYDAYNQRPADEGMVELRGADYWNEYKHRRDIEERARYRRDRFEMEKLTEGALDTSEVEHSTNRVRRETFLYFQHYPINEMIQESFVRIREIVPKGGGDKIVLDRVNPHDLSIARGPEERVALEKLNADVDIPLQEARRLAQDLGLDLIRVGSLNTQKSDRRVVALCQIGDHREHLRDMIKFKIQKAGVQPPPTRECVEVPFRGGTHPHAIRFKSVGIAKHLLHRHAVRVNLTKFGTPREGFPVFQSILDEIKRQCLQLRAYHKAGEIQANYDEIYCYLYPSTGRSPKTTVDHPTPQTVREVRDFRVLENEKEIYFDDLHNQITQKERLAYMTKLDKGTAWADKDEGMSLQRQRAIKVMLGYLPKGNKELYAARGDVNVPAPFRTSHMTSTERWANPVESNLEQASRGAAALGKRAAMPISEMHDTGETPENPTQLDRFYYRVQGPALEVGEFKEALGLKDNRKKRPPLGPGYGTIGVGVHTGFEPGTVAK